MCTEARPPRPTGQGEELEVEDHIARSCGFEMLDEDGAPTAAAFLRKPGEQGLSTDWVECFCGTSERERIAHLYSFLLGGRHRVPGRRGAFAVLNVGEIVGRGREYVEENGIEDTVRVLYTPAGHRESHAEICGITHAVPEKTNDNAVTDDSEDEEKKLAEATFADTLADIAAGHMHPVAELVP